MRLLILSLVFIMCTAASGLAQIQSGFGIMFLDREPPGFETMLSKAVKDFPEVTLEKTTDESKIRLEYEWVAIEKFPLPKPGAFELFALGLEPSDRDRIVASKRTIYLNFIYSDKNVLHAIRTISKLVGSISKETGAAVWDDETRQILSATEWTKLRLDSWIGEQVDIRRHITMHEYRDPELRRIITLGLRKFGLPDLVMDGVPGEISRSAGNTIHYVAQTLSEQGEPKDERFVLNLGKIRHKNVRTSALENPLKGATGIVKVRLSATPREEGDADNRLMKLDFPDEEGADSSEKMSRAFSTLYGAEKELLYARRNDEELIAARNRARAVFLKKKEIFKAGLRPNERLSVKYGFTNGTNTEYMWAEIFAWDGDELAAVLTNDAYNIEGLKAGKKVKIPVGEIYDYLHYYPDGRIEGNETGEILEKRKKGESSMPKNRADSRNAGAN